MSTLKSLVRTRGARCRSLPLCCNVFIVALFAASLASCTPGTIWNIKYDTFSKNIHAGHFDFLKEIDYSKVNLSDITRLGDNAPFYMSYVLREVGRPVVALHLLQLEWRRGNGIWQKEAADQLITYYLQTQEYAKAEELAKEAYSYYPQRSYYRQLLAAWYWQHKDEDVLRGLQKIASFKNAKGAPIVDPELALFRAVSSYRLGKPGWQKLFMDLFSEQPATELQIRAYEFFKLEKDMKSQFTSTQWAFLKAKYEIAEQQFGPALTTLKPLIDAHDPLLLTPWDLRDLGRAYIGSSEPLTGAGVFERLISLLLANGGTAESLYAAYSTLGQLYSTASWYSHASVSFKRAIGYAPDSTQYDRMAWNIIDSEVKRSPSGAVGEVAKYAKLWHTPSYFNDVLGELCTDLVQHRDWALLWKLYHELEGHADNRIIVRLAYDVASAIDRGYIDIPNGKQVAHGLMDKVISLDANRYYTFLASARLDKLPLVFKPDPTQPTVKAAPGGENTDFENLITGFLTYSLYGEAYTFARSNTRALGNQFLLLLVRQLHRQGRILESLRLMDELVARPGVRLTLPELKLYYPQPYSAIIESVAKKEGLSLPVFYGLVREESYFKSSIVSTAGAVGLTQLMPATAQDIAHRMGMKDPQIRNADDNLAIGGHYLRMLIDNFHDIGEALFAYNAGYTRVYRWKSLYPGLPDDLFLEAVPINQTQGYVKKILVSAVSYGYLYYGLSPRKVVKEILPTF